MPDRHEIPARRGVAVRLSARQSIRIVNTHGGQVVDLWAFSARAPGEWMSMAHSVVAADRIKPKPGSVLVTNRRAPILTLTEDSSPGVHCMLFAACDRERYRLLGCTAYHDNCADNLASALVPFGISPAVVPTPLNLFMNTIFDAEGAMTVAAPPAQPGDSVTFRAERDCILAMSACPQDLLPVNGADCTPKPAAYELF
ncbi:MAG: DUF1989 domain-containing protein [Alphaproteobacteria bacterium]